MSRRAFEHFSANRSVGAGVTGHARAHREQMSLGVAGHFIVHGDGVAFGMDADALLPIQSDLGRPAGEMGDERGLGLDGHVLLAAERAAVGSEHRFHFFVGQVQERGHLTPVVEDALSLGVETQAAVLARFGQAGLGFQVEMLDALGLIVSFDHVGRGREGLVGVPATDRGAGEKVVVGGIHARRSLGQSGGRRGHGLEHFVLHFHQTCRGAGSGFAVCGHDGQHVAHAAHFFAHRHQSGPVG